MDYPKFFEVDDVLVVVTLEEGEEMGRSVPLGKPYPPLRAVNEGEELSRDEFLAKLKEQFPDSKLTSLF